MPTEGPAQCLSQRISCRLLLARVSLQQSLPSQHVAPANRPSSGSSSGNPAEASRLFRWNLCVEMSLVSLETIASFAPNLSLRCFEFPKLQSLFAASGSAPGPRPIQSIFHPAKPISILSAISRIAPKTPTRPRRRWPRTASPPSLCHQGPSTRCFSTAPRSPWNS